MLSLFGKVQVGLVAVGAGLLASAYYEWQASAEERRKAREKAKEERRKRRKKWLLVAGAATVAACAMSRTFDRGGCRNETVLESCLPPD